MLHDVAYGLFTKYKPVKDMLWNLNILSKLKQGEDIYWQARPFWDKLRDDQYLVFVYKQ